MHAVTPTPEQISVLRAEQRNPPVQRFAAVDGDTVYTFTEGESFMISAPCETWRSYTVTSPEGVAIAAAQADVRAARLVIEHARFSWARPSADEVGAFNLATARLLGLFHALPAHTGA